MVKLSEQSLQIAEPETEKRIGAIDSLWNQF